MPQLTADLSSDASQDDPHLHRLKAELHDKLISGIDFSVVRSIDPRT
jgi:hypothetical protein